MEKVYLHIELTVIKVTIDLYQLHLLNTIDTKDSIELDQLKNHF